MAATPDLEALKAEIKAEFPGFRIERKSDSKLMRAVEPFMARPFMTSFTTTIWNTVYVPDEFDALPIASRCVILRHERVHMRQARRLTFPLFALLYLLVVFPIGLAWFRMKFEQEAYAESLAASKEYGLDYSSPARRESMVQYFVGPDYGYMWPFRRSIERWFDAAVARLDA